MNQPTEPKLSRALPAKLREVVQTFSTEDQAYFLLEFIQQTDPKAADWEEISRPDETNVAEFSELLAELLTGLPEAARAALLDSFVHELDREKRWDALVASQESQAHLKKAAKAAIDKHVLGESLPLYENLEFINDDLGERAPEEHP